MAINLMYILAGSGTRVILQKYFGVESAMAHTLIGFSMAILIPIIGLIIIER
jgi:hypothetical protein